MLCLIAILVGLTAIPDQVTGVYVRIQAVNANSGVRAEIVVVLSTQTSELGLSKHSDTQSATHKEVFEINDVPNSDKRRFFIKGDKQHPITVTDEERNGLYIVKLGSSGQNDIKTHFVIKNQKIYCFADKHQADERKYTLQYNGNNFGCGSEHGSDAETMVLVPDEDVKLAGNVFFIVSKTDPNGKISLADKDGARQLRYDSYNVDQMWQVKAASQAGWYNIYSVKFPDVMLSWYGTRTTSESSNHDVLWRFEKLEDNLGDEWDFYKIWRYPKDGWRANLQMSAAGSSDGPYHGIWRLVPRFKVIDLGYTDIKNLKTVTDVKVEVKFTSGVQLTTGEEVSTTEGLTLSLKAAAEHGPFSASFESTITGEIKKITKQTAVSSWSREEKETYLFPAGKKCTLWQRELGYESPLKKDSMTQKRSDLIMECVPI